MKTTNELKYLKIKAKEIGIICSSKMSIKQLKIVLENPKKNREIINEINSKFYCEHKISKYKCRKCSPKSFCPHNKQKALCRECGGKHFCEHQKQKYTCHILLIKIKL